MKKLVITLICLFVVFVASTAFGQQECMVKATWTPSVDAHEERFFVDDVEQTSCTNPGKCNFIVDEVAGRVITVRSYNKEGRYVDVEKTLEREALPQAATNFTVTIICPE